MPGGSQAPQGEEMEKRIGLAQETFGPQLRAKDDVTETLEDRR